MTKVGIDTSLALHLNDWGVSHRTMTEFAAKQFVYAVIGVGLIWVVSNTYQTIKPFSIFPFLKRGVWDGVTIVVIPVGIATLISEGISQIYFRPRPFAALSGIHLLTPHSADGGMPSHHTVFMAAMATAIYLRNKLVGLSMGILTLLCGLARIAAGVHYPTDVLAGLAIGIGTVLIIDRFLKDAIWRNTKFSSK